MSGIGTDATQWNAVLAPVAGGLVVRQDNGFGAMLGLRAGDRITQANGIALSAPEDVGAAIVRPLVANQGVRLIGSRDGTTQELWLANVACAG
jgi:S1-C subfamily serine protease